MTTTDPVTEHDARCPEITEPQLAPDPDRCTCRDQDGKTPRRPGPSWADGPMCGFDLETTAADPFEARIVTASIVRVRPGVGATTLNWLSDVDGQEIPAEAANVHGISTEKARAEGRPHADVVAEIGQTLALEWAAGIPVVIFNASYDLTVQAEEHKRLGIPFAVGGPVIDPLVLDRGLDRFRKGKRTLGVACSHYGVDLSEADAHSSDADSLAACRVAWKIARRYPVVGEMSLDALMKWQAEKHRAWANGFGAYLRKNGKTDDVSRAWPMREDAA